MISKKKVGIIDYGAGNHGSIFNAIQYLGAQTKIVSSPSNLNQYSHLILPGVGSFGKLAVNLKKKDWPNKIKNFVQQGKSLFGICVGMQLLFEQSEESKNAFGLSLIKGKFNIFNKLNNLPSPHVGFNEVNHKNSSIWKGVKNKSPFYFIHSFRVKKTQEDVTVAKTIYGEEFISFIEKDNIYGSQFHPEKSHFVGLKLLKNFLEINH
jgi:imidazole glycerol phosphate synthase glutamine amidotransferase subunit